MCVAACCSVIQSAERLGLLVESEAVKSLSQVVCVVVCCSMFTPWFARDVGSRQEACRKSCVLPTRVEERAYNICQVQRSVRFLSFTYSETRIIARDSHSLFWNSDYRQRFPLKSNELWRYRKQGFGVTVLKFPLSPLHSTSSVLQCVQCVAGFGLLVESGALKC